MTQQIKMTNFPKLIGTIFDRAKFFDPFFTGCENTIGKLKTLFCKLKPSIRQLAEQPLSKLYLV